MILWQSAVMKKDEAVSWLQQRICGWFREVGRVEGAGGSRSQALLRLYAFWQVKYQECVLDSCDVWSSFLYMPCSHQYIQHIESSTSRCVCAVFENILCTVCLETATFI
jgi:hypothetical protein